VPTADDVLRDRARDAAWSYDPDRLPPVPVRRLPKNSSAAQHAAQVREDEQAAAVERERFIDQQATKVKAERRRRTRLRGVSSADLLAARVLNRPR
jgi:hypothetical protein